jgi:Uma2 family endonuclease
MEIPMSVATRQETTHAVVLRTSPAITFTDDEFFDFCLLNSAWAIERGAEGELEIMSPAGGESSRVNVYIGAQLMVWALEERSGVVYGSSAGFILPNGATRSPDAAWIGRDRFEQLDERQKTRFVPLCPDFVVEVRSPSDSMSALRRKMEEYLANGAALGWLIDPDDRRVEVYRQGSDVQTLEAPATLMGDQVLPGFTLDLSLVWNAEL